MSDAFDGPFVITGGTSYRGTPLLFDREPAFALEVTAYAASLGDDAHETPIAGVAASHTANVLGLVRYEERSEAKYVGPAASALLGSRLVVAGFRACFTKELSEELTRAFGAARTVSLLLGPVGFTENVENAVKGGMVSFGIVPLIVL